jgi:hypothetical protein
VRALRSIFGFISSKIGLVLPGGLMDFTVAGRIHMILFFMTFVGPIVALICWQTQNRIDDVLEHGIIAQATVTEVKEFRVMRTRDPTHSVSIVWRDIYGGERRVGLGISATYFRSIKATKAPAVVPIRYLPNEPTSFRNTVLTDDTQRNSDSGAMARFFLAIGLLSFVVTALMTWWRRRKSPPLALTV